MSKVLRDNGYIKVTEVTVEHKEINKDMVLGSVNTYLKTNLISGERYECLGFHEVSDREVTVELKRVGEDLYNDGYVDEDFDDDLYWKAFCKEMENILEVRHFGVPYWYYPK